MPLKRLQADEVYRIGIASPLAFANWTSPTTVELNANPTNDPSGLIFDLTCAINTSDSQFDLDDPTFDESLTFCQTSGNKERITENATIIFDFARATRRWSNAASLLSADGFNTANLALSLLAWRGVEYFAYISIGKAASANFVVHDRISLARVGTDWGIDKVDTGSKAHMTQNFAFRGDLLWNYDIAA